jgi:hypothetical protein
LEINVESIFVARVCLGLAGLTHAGQWGCALFEGTPHARCRLWYASSTGPVGPTRVVGFRRGGRDLFCGALPEGTPYTRYQVVYSTRFAWGSQA